MRKLMLAPSQAGYSVDYGQGSLYVALSGGPGASRRDFIGNVSYVEVNWSLPRLEADYLLAFRRSATGGEAEPFLIDLSLDGADLEEYQASFVPGTFKMSGYRGNERSFSAQLEVKPLAEDSSYDSSLLDIYDAFGSDSSYALSLLEALVNVDLGGGLSA